MSDKTFEKFDPETGGIFEDEFSAYRAKHRGENGFSGRWFAISQEAYSWLARSRKSLGMEDFTVLFALLSRLEYDNIIKPINQAEMARELGMDRHHVNRAISRLVSMDVIRRGEKKDGNSTLTINPRFAWK